MPWVTSGDQGLVKHLAFGEPSRRQAAIEVSWDQTSDILLSI